MNINIKKIIILVLLALSSRVFSCKLSYTLIDSNGAETRVTPDMLISLDKSSSYTLKSTFYQDHGRCDLSYDETLFYLEDEKWKTSKDYLPLLLKEPIEWTGESKRKFVTNIKFTAVQSGDFSLEVIRDCSRKEGYYEILKFKVN